MGSNDLIPRHLHKVATEVLDAFPIVVVEGARQVGKSTFAQMLIDGRRSRSVTLDDPRTETATHTDPTSFAEQFHDGTLLIDEIQRVPRLILPLKASVDRDRRPGRFLLTGSSDLLRLERTPDSLAGRAVTLKLHGLSQGELTGTSDDFVSRLDALRLAPDFASTWGRADYVAALRQGGYPELRDQAGRPRTMWIDSYLDRIVQRDASLILDTPQPGRLLSVLRLLAANQSGELVKARVARDAGIPATSVTAYLDALHTLFLVSSLPPWTPNLTRREAGRHKTIVNDPALAMRLADVSDDVLVSLTGSDHLGPLLEGLVVAELIKQRGWSDTDFRLSHYRTRAGVEVDIIIELSDGRLYGIEVKASGTYRSDDFRGLRTLRDHAGDRFLGGVVLNTSDSGYQYAQKLWGMPISALWEWSPDHR
ncbi:ATP-binding protein [Nocardioides speluncae]|uniref:ATP-binding protein n=1 Tax=Nocardioides speluncae TaxID=2670337 RepID=UPI000D6959B7|nr:ATP-binding protein [Nocardioides speluncae]